MCFSDTVPCSNVLMFAFIFTNVDTLCEVEKKELRVKEIKNKYNIPSVRHGT